MRSDNPGQITSKYEVSKYLLNQVTPGDSFKINNNSELLMVEDIYPQSDIHSEYDVEIYVRCFDGVKIIFCNNTIDEITPPAITVSTDTTNELEIITALTTNRYDIIREYTK